ncbi:tetratricopeptide repeat protein [Micromonospora sp. BQ11]|uniref:tetratricopeptide repeat protein n=1 Tax=Micromonospora sp. BQ11 TaxID=3452212 RepID=UPI003F892B9F
MLYVTPDRTPPARHEVVICCSGEEEVATAAIAESLLGDGVTPFIAGPEASARPDGGIEVIKALSACDVAVFLLSAAAVGDSRVLESLALAVGERRYVVPLAMPGTAYPEGLPPQWMYWLSPAEVQPYQGHAETVALVRRILGEVTSARRAVTPRGRRLRGVTGALAMDAIGGGWAGPDAPPSALLRAQSRAMPLIGRDEELARLESWALRDDLFGVRLITGAAGQGKSRLARELGGRLAAADWQVIEIRRALPVSDALRQLGDRPSLLVVDYAETQADRVAELVEAMADVDLFAAVRLLLLARGAGEWWTQLISRSAIVEDLLSTAGILTLSSLAEDREASTAIYSAARAGFRAALGLPADEADEATYRRQRSIFDIIEAALADLIATTMTSERTGTALPLLAHERRYVLAAAEDEGLDGLDGVELDRFLTVLTLFGAVSERSTIELLSTVDSDLGLAELRKLARLCRRLYPGEDRYVDGVKPDSLAEKLVAQVATDDPVLIGGHALWHSSAVGPEQLRRALIILARAAATYPVVVPQLRRIIEQARFETLAAAIEVSTLVPDPSVLVDQLDHVLQTQARTPGETLDMLGLIPDETVALAELAAQLARVAISGLPPEGARSRDETELLLAASNRFSDAGWGLEAANAAASAVKDLEATRNESERLARARSNLSNRLWETGRVKEALAPARRAVEWFTTFGGGALAAATAESNLAFRLFEMGALDAALHHATNALLAFWAAGVKGAEATPLNNLTCMLVARRDYEAAVRHGSEAVRIRRAQAFDNRDRFLPFIARALANTAPAALAAGNVTGARKLIAEARALHEITARKAPIFAYEQAESAAIDGVMLAVSGSTAEARAAFEVASRILSPLGTLGDLHDRLAGALKHNLDVLEACDTVGWGDVAVVRQDVPSHETGAVLLLPQLLEYKDL